MKLRHKKSIIRSDSDRNADRLTATEMEKAAEIIVSSQRTLPENSYTKITDEMEKFDVNIPWKPPGKNFMATIQRIQRQKCTCCSPLRLLLTSREIFTGQKTVLEITETSKKFVNLYHLFKIYNTSAAPQLDELIAYMSSRVTE